MSSSSRFPWPSIVATFAVALAAYGLGLLYTVEYVKSAAREARSLQVSRLNQTALRLEDYLGDVVQLSNVAAVTLVHEEHRSDVEQDLRQFLSASNSKLVFGIGGFYAPFAFEHRPRYGVYLFNEPGSRGRIIMTDNARSTYDYLTRPWYRAAERADGRAAFTGPYTSPHGFVFIGESESFSSHRRLAGVVLVEALQSSLNRMLTRTFARSDRFWITDANGATILRTSGSAFTPDGSVSTRLRLAPWTVHLASTFPQVARARRMALVVGLPVSITYWLIAGLVALAFARVRRLQIKTLDLQETANRDPLTGLRNRAYMLDRLERGLADFSADESKRFAVLFVDLDRFAIVNDSLGHAVGDRLLSAIARRIERMLPEGIEFGRVGGDEFVAYVPFDRDTVSYEPIAHAIIGQLNACFMVDGREIYISASIGVVLASPRYSNADELLRDADTAMYAAKRAGRGRFAIFDEHMREHVLARLSLENALRRALDNAQIFARYQPIVSLRTGQVVGLEALARWTNELGQTISPDAFIPLAEQCGAIEALDAVILAQACAYAKHLQERWPGLSMSVNISTSRLHQTNLATKVRNVLETVGLEPRLLKLELTETAIMDGAQEGAPELKRLRELGAHVVIDDFGTGYSSLSYVQHLPVSGLKIDRSFVAPLARHSQTLAIIRAILALANTLELSVVAEGVETAAQAEILGEMGVEHAQGFYYAPALDAADLEAFIATHPAHSSH